MMPYERLKAWEACLELWIAVYMSSKKWPTADRYGLTAQIKRASLSSGANIAEGVSKRGVRDCARHVNISIGSLGEVAFLLLAARKVDIIDEETHRELLRKQQE